MRRYFITGTALMILVLLVSACNPAVIPATPASIVPSTVKPDTEQEPVRAEENNGLRTISVVGSGQVYLVPDVAYIYIGVHSQSENVSTALKDNNEQAKQVSDALKQLGVDEKDIQTTSFNIYPSQQYEPGTGAVTGTLYMVDNTVYVTVRDLERLGEILDTVVRSGANSINGISFDVVDKESAQSEARELAMTNAREQAEELARVSGLALGEIQTISAGYTSSPMAKEMYGVGGGGGMMASNYTPVSAGQLVLSAEVSVTFFVK